MKMRNHVLGSVSSRLNSLNKQIINLQSELVSARQLLRNQTVNSPIDGRVFDVKISPSSVVNNSQALLKVVPSGALSASLKFLILILVS